MSYPGLESSPWHARQVKYLPNGGGAILTFGIKGGAEAGQPLHRGARAVQPPRQRRRRPQPGDPPRDATHSQLSETEQVSTGVTVDLVRLCIGLETLSDILADLEAGFRSAKGA